MARLGAVGEGRVEVDEVAVRVAARGRQEADPRPLGPDRARATRMKSSSSGLSGSIEKPPPPIATIVRGRAIGKRAYSRTDGGRSRSNMWTVSMKRICFDW